MNFDYGQSMDWDASFLALDNDMSAFGSISDDLATGQSPDMLLGGQSESSDQGQNPVAPFMTM
jgi:hypothetical protein